MGNELTLTLVGCGGMMGAHVNGYRVLWEKGLREFRILACCDVNAQNAAKTADAVAAFQGTRPALYEHVEKMLDAERSLDAVDISVLHSEHHTVALPCLEAKKHVTIEKPLAITMRAGKMILEAARRRKLSLQVAENYRRSPEARAFRWAIEQGRIGRIRQIHWVDVGERLWYWTWRDHRLQAGGGWSLDGGVHFADLFLYFIGEVDSLFGIHRAYQPVRYGKPETMEAPIAVDVEDTTMAIVEFKNGASGVWTHTSASPGKGAGLRRISGEHGSLLFGEGLSLRKELIPTAALQEQFLASLDAASKERLFPRGITDGVACELNEFIRHLLHGEPLETDGRSGYKAEALCIAIYESAELRRPVKISDIESLKLERYQRPINRAVGIRTKR